MLEIFKSQTETDAAVCPNNSAKLVQVSGFAVCGQAHNLVFIPKFAKSEVLGHCRVIHAKGMRKSDRSCNAHAISLTGSPHGAGEIAQPIRGEQCSLFERRNEERAG